MAALPGLTTTSLTKEPTKALVSVNSLVLRNSLISSYAFDHDILTRISSVCDAHLRLQTERSAARLLKTIEVAKIRGAEVPTGNISGFEVEPGIGIRIVPISKARA